MACCRTARWGLTIIEACGWRPGGGGVSLARAAPAEGRRLTAAVLLVENLGGGWSEGELPSAAEVTR